jgi:hypothetical protein
MQFYLVVGWRVHYILLLAGTSSCLTVPFMSHSQIEQTVARKGGPRSL